MKHLKKLKLYNPKKPALGVTVSYLCDDDGNDWYDSQKEFSPNTVKIAYDKNGIVVAVSRDISMLWPINLSVVEFSSNKIPPNLSDSGDWVFDGLKIIPREYTDDEIIYKTEQKKKQLIENAYSLMKPLELANKHHMSTEEENKKLMELEKYVVTLNRMDTSTGQYIEFPVFK